MKTWIDVWCKVAIFAEFFLCQEAALNVLFQDFQSGWWNGASDWVKVANVRKCTVMKTLRKTYSFGPEQVSDDVLARVLRFWNAPQDKVLPPCGQCLQYRDLASRKWWGAAAADCLKVSNPLKNIFEKFRNDSFLRSLVRNKDAD